ncbi:MAG: glycosyltransferase family 2 protein [Janthinobacterium lividum]
MPKVDPYIIYHLQLENQTKELVFPEIDKSGYYCVFWWKEIALGQLYIEKNKRLSSEQLQQKILSAIKPTIDFYQHKNSITIDYAQAFLNKTPLFIEIMEDFFSRYITTSFPEKVNVSVVICTRNRSESLRLCLNSLHQQICMPEEIIVVDNAPTDDSTKLVAEQFSDVIYCREVRPGLDIARNTGAKKAKCTIVAYTDDDVQVHQQWTYKIWETFLDKNVQAITGLVISTSLDTESQQIFEKYWGFNKGYQDIFFKKDFVNTGFAPKVWDIGAGANMAFRKQLLEDVDFFDERLDVGAAGCSGDSEIWYRILAAGYTIQYTPRAIVFHEHRKQMDALQKQVFSYMRGHAAAALVQDAKNKKDGYKKYIYYSLPKYYIYLLKQGFPTYSFRYQTLFSEIKGIASGIKFYHKNKIKPPTQ